MTIQEIKFGTDGWRGGIAETYTFENVRRCAQGFASYLKKKHKNGDYVVVGYDKRFLSENFAHAVSEVLAGNDFKVYLTNEATPTPVIAFSVINKKAIAAINITASHNPPTDNGFKVRDENGGAIDPEGLSEIESLLPEDVKSINRKNFKDALREGLIIEFDPKPAYIDHLKHLVDLEPIKQAGFNIMVDAMWGNGAGWFPVLLSGGKTTIKEIHNTRHPLFPEMSRPEPIQPNIDAGLNATVMTKSDVLLINDGDADRFGLGDENGRFINQLQVFALLAYYLLEIKKQRGPIVKTLSTTSMLNKLGEIYDVPVFETGVGFKYVAPKMLETNALIGGEESGGFAFRGNVPERDGILAGLYILDLMVKTGKKPSELLGLLFSVVGGHYYGRKDRIFSGDRKAREDQILSANPSAIAGFKVLGLNTTDGFKYSLDDGGWLLIRFSGTEPLMRVYCETTKEEKIEEILSHGLAIAGLK